MTNTTKTVLGIIVLVLIVWGISSLVKKSEPEETGPIKIGFLGPLTGDLANIGKNAQAAVQIASDEINAAGLWMYPKIIPCFVLLFAHS